MALDDDDRRILGKVQAIYAEASPSFEPARREEAEDFGLGRAFAWHATIVAVDLPRLRAALGVDDLDAWFDEVFYATPRYDASGNLVAIPISEAGSDIWPFEELAALAPFVEEDGFILVQDESSRFWMLWFHGSRLHYLKEKTTPSDARPSFIDLFNQLGRDRRALAEGRLSTEAFSHWDETAISSEL